MAIQILLVENNLQDRNEIKKVLKRKGGNNFVVREAPSYADFSKLIHGNTYDLILVNPYIPVFKGSGILEIINSIIPQVPVIVLCSDQTEITVTLAEYITPYFFLKKQTVADNLLKTIVSAVENKQVLLQYKTEHKWLQQLNRYFNVTKQFRNLIKKSSTEEELLNGVCRIFNKVQTDIVAWAGMVNEANLFTPLNWPGSVGEPAEGVDFTLFWELFQSPEFIEHKKNTCDYFLCDDILLSAEISYVFIHELKSNIRSFITFPILRRKKIIALFTLQSEIPMFFEKEETRLMEELVGEISSALCNIYKAEINKLDKLKLVRAKEQAEQKDELKSAFLLNISHEIRTPMNGILGFADLLNEHNLSRYQIQTYIDVINQSSRRMLETIDNLVSMSKIEAGEVVLNKVEVDLNLLLKDISESYKINAREKGLQLHFKEYKTSRPFVYKTDKLLLQFIISNLLMNAIKFTNKGYIEYGFTETVGNIEFYVKDTGMGIEKKKYELIFEKFRQGDEGYSRQYDGSGLGLAITKAYVEKLNGKIWVNSVLGEGTIFYFTLPLINSSKKNKEESSKKEVIREKGLKILIVEDDPASTMLLKFLVKDFSKEILEVCNGVEAVNVCKKNNDIDLIVMDLQMSGINGYEATRQIREFNKDVIIIAQSAYATVQNKEKALYMGCNDFITKPIQKIEFLTTVNKYV